MVYPVRNLTSIDGYFNEVRLHWDAPIDFSSSQDIIICRRKDQYPVELQNDSGTYNPKHKSGITHVSGFTDYNQVEVFNGTVVYPTGAVTATAGVINDAGAAWTINAYKGRIVRDAVSNNYRILSNTATSLVLDTTSTPDITDSIFIILPDFPANDWEEFSSTTGSAAVGGVITDISSEFDDLRLQTDELVNMLVVIGSTTYYVTSNTSSTFTLNAAPTLGATTYTILAKFGTLGKALPFSDTYLNSEEAASYTGTGLEDEQYYHYTAFCNDNTANIAEAVFHYSDDSKSTMVVGTSCKDRSGQDRLYGLWPGYNRDVDSNGDMFDVMGVMDSGLNEVRTHVNLFRPYQSKTIHANATKYVPMQFGLNKLSNKIGIGAFRRLGDELVSINKLKGSKEGLYELIRTITEWDITGGSGDIDGAIDDGANILYFRFWSDIWPDNARMFGFVNSFDNDGGSAYTYTNATGNIVYAAGTDLTDVSVGYVFVGTNGGWYPILEINVGGSAITIRIEAGLDPGGLGIMDDAAPTGDSGDVLSGTPLANSARFLNTQIGVVIPGIFSTRLVSIKVPNIALHEGVSTGMTPSTLTDATASFPDLTGNFILPKESEPTNLYKITSNTATSITIDEKFSNIASTGDYAILSPLNAQRLLEIYNIIKDYIPTFCTVIFEFENTL